MSAAVLGRTLAEMATQTNPLLPAALPQSGLELTVVGTGRLIARSRRGALPTAAEIHAGNVTRAVESDADAVMDALQRGIAAFVRGARAKLAQVAR